MFQNHIRLFDVMMCDRALPRQQDSLKGRVDMNLTFETRNGLREVVEAEREEDRAHDCPERRKTEIYEMIVRKGLRVWKQEHADIKAIAAR
jgi:hypothetical protein